MRYQRQRTHWVVLAARLAAENPSWSWSKVCSELARRPRKQKPQLVVAKIFWWNEI